MKRLLIAMLVAFATSVSAAPVLITTNVLANDANGIAEDQTLVGAGNLTLDGALASDQLPEAQRISFESTGNLSGVTFTVTCRDSDQVSYTEDIAGPNNGTVTTTGYCKYVTQIAADGAVGTNVEVGVLAANGMATRTIKMDMRKDPRVSLGVELSAGTGTFGLQYSLDNPSGSYDSTFQNDASWRDAVALDPDTNTATGEDNIIAPVQAVRGLVTTGSTTGVYKFKVIQADPRY